MTPVLAPDAIRALAAEWVGVASVSGDGSGENRCAQRIAAHFPAGLPQGDARTPDDRAVPWTLVRGRRARTVLLLGHHDTVGAGEYAALGAPEGARVAFDPAALRERLLESRASAFAPTDAARRDLEEERSHPGTWMFGRGALDMKSGLAAGLAALHALAADPPECGVLFASCPDEERHSAGMLTLVEALPRLASERGLEFAGVLNLDYSEAPVAWTGVTGKCRVLIWALGAPTHVGSPFAGVDAAQLAAAVARAATASDALADRAGATHGPPAVLLGLRDLKAAYDVQTAREAIVDLNVLTLSRSAADVLAAACAVARSAADALAADMRDLHGLRGEGACAWAPGAIPVLTFEALRERAGGDEPGSAEAPADLVPYAASRLRALAERAALAGPAVVVALLPPFYPAAGPGASAFTQAATRVLRQEGIEVRAHYPYISDASFAAWRGESPTAIRAQWPRGLERACPSPEGATLDLDVVNVGPWGRDAHGLFERVHAPWAFERLPALIEQVVRAVR